MYRLIDHNVFNWLNRLAFRCNLFVCTMRCRIYAEKRTHTHFRHHWFICALFTKYNQIREQISQLCHFSSHSLCVKLINVHDIFGFLLFGKFSIQVKGNISYALFACTEYRRQLECTFSNRENVLICMRMRIERDRTLNVETEWE